jgi:hypothetical protein
LITNCNVCVIHFWQKQNESTSVRLNDICNACILLKLGKVYQGIITMLQMCFICNLHHKPNQTKPACNVRYITKEKSKITAELKINNAISSKETEKNQQYFSYIVAISFIGGGNLSTRRKPPTCRI